MRSFPFPVLLFYFSWSRLATAQYTVYQPKQQVIYGGSYLNLTAAQTSTAAAPNFTSGAAYDKMVLTPPAVPNPAIPMQVSIQLPSSGGFQNMSPPANGGFMGFSIEMSVANQVCESSRLSSSSALTNVGLSGKEQVCNRSHFTIQVGHPHINLQKHATTGPIPESYGKHRSTGRLGSGPGWWQYSRHRRAGRVSSKWDCDRERFE